MTTDKMRRAISIEAEARKLKKQFDEYVLLKVDSGCTREVINVGDPVSYRKGEYHRVEIAIDETVRRLAFRAWRKNVALKFNEYVRELAQIGASTDLRLIAFSAATGDPQ